MAATNKRYYYAFSNNKKIDNPQNIAARLAPILDNDKEKLAVILADKNKIHQVLARDLTQAQVNAVQATKIDGIGIAPAVDRFYPKNMTSAVLGFVGFDGNRRVGQYGVEAYYDNVLGGSAGGEWFGNRTYSNIIGFFNSVFKKKETAADNLLESADQKQEGQDIILTIDPNIQSFVEVILENLIQKWSAESGQIIVQEPISGKILAMALKPTFDPNSYRQYKLEDFINSAVQQVFEPGSSFKSITMSAALDKGAVTPETTYTDSGIVQIGGYTVRNFDDRSHGIQTMRQVLQKSLNTGAIFAEEKLGDDDFLNYVVAFGFGQKSGIDLPGEISGNISNLFSGRKINFATASFGQGVAVTPLQLVNAYSAIANGGKLMRPYVVWKIVRTDGVAEDIKPKVIGSPVSELTAAKMKSMLVDVVEKGFDKARIAGYDVAGKTGTAQIPDERGGYLEGDQFIHNFVGFAPAYSPRFTVLIKMDKPKGIRFAADSLSPAFGEIARYLIRYFNIPPTK